MVSVSPLSQFMALNYSGLLNYFKACEGQVYSSILDLSSGLQTLIFRYLFDINI